jgi:hypothetical protein
MNDYLRNLAARSMNLADVIQPRRASRFEPTQVHGALGLRAAVPSFTDEHEMTESVAQASIHPQHVQRAEPQTALSDEHARRRSRLAQTQPITPVLQGANIVPVPAQPSAEAQSETMPEPQPLSPLAPHSVPSVAPTVSAPPQAPPSRRSDSRLQTLRDHIEQATAHVPSETVPEPPPPSRPASRAVAASTPTVSAPPQAPSSRRSDSRPQPAIDHISMRSGVRLPGLDGIAQSAVPKRQPALQPITASTIEREVIERRTAPPAQVREPQPPLDGTQVVVIQSRVMPVERRGADRRNSDPLSLSAQAPPPAPTIHVTIGRVEVRATAPTVPASKPRPAPRTMSLDDYLRQRSRGGKP